MAANTGDHLRALDLAEAVADRLTDGDTDRVIEIVTEVSGAGETVADGLYRMMNLLYAYIGVSVPIGKEMIARIRQQIVDEEISTVSATGSGTELPIGHNTYACVGLSARQPISALRGPLRDAACPVRQLP
jgi:hypothetical protein